MLALFLVRACGWQLSNLVSHPAIDGWMHGCASRGWLAVLSLRLIPAVPFSVINYAAGASAVRVLPYTLATLLGLLPGTAAVVILGDALTGNVSPTLFLVSVCTAQCRRRRTDLRDPQPPHASRAKPRPAAKRGQRLGVARGAASCSLAQPRPAGTTFAVERRRKPSCSPAVSTKRQPAG